MRERFETAQREFQKVRETEVRRTLEDFTKGKDYYRPANGVIDVELMTSRDGLLWERNFRDAFFLPRGAQPGSFDSGLVGVAGMLLVMAALIMLLRAQIQGRQRRIAMAPV
mgnify:CR=1 FL=1